MQTFRDGVRLLALLSAVSAPMLAQSATIRVPADVSTIQGAIDAAVDGDEVVVAPGQYTTTPPITFAGKAITVRSEQGPAVTEITHVGPHDVTGPIFTFNSGEGSGSVLQGFRITGGSLYHFAVLSIGSASPTIVGNEFVDVASRSTLTMTASNARIERNLFHSSWCGSSASEGTITASASSSPTIANNVFYDNEYCVAIVVSLAGTSSPRIVNNTMLGTMGGVRANSTAGTGQLIARNNVIANSPGVGTFGFRLADSSASVVWENNLVFGVQQPYIGIADQTGINGNLMADPALSGGEALDFRPDTSASPVVDAGLNSEVQPGDLDFHGEARINPATNIVDLGAAEFYTDAPTVLLTLSPTTILPGQTAELDWTSTGADSCVASGTWAGAQSLQGSLTLNPTVPGNHDYTLTCVHDGVRRSDTVTLRVEPPPSINMDASPSRTAVVLGDPLILLWSAEYATSCEASGDWSGTKTLRNTETLQPSVGERTFALTCTGPGGSVTNSLTLDVVPAPTVTLSINATTILTTGSATLRWTGENVSSCTAGSAWSGSLGASGERVLSGLAAGTYTYEIECTSPAEYRSVEATAVLTVNQAPAAPPPTDTSVPRRNGGGGALGPFWILIMFALAASRQQLLRRSKASR